MEVPCLGRRPPPISAQTWNVSECNDRIFVWHHAHGKEPDYEVTQ